jgi:hypothetical protein
MHDDDRRLSRWDRRLAGLDEDRLLRWTLAVTAGSVAVSSIVSVLVMLGWLGWQTVSWIGR